MKYIEQGTKDGAKLLRGGEPVQGGGHFVKPAVFTGVERLDGDRAGGDIRAGGGGDALRQSRRGRLLGQRGTAYGLVAAVWTKDVKKAHRMAQTLKAGTVWINCYHFVDAAAPWGGWQARAATAARKARMRSTSTPSSRSVWIDLN